MIIQGDCLEILPTLEAESVQMVVTSPPYWGLRDYGVEGQLGLEKQPEHYVAKMVCVFREVRRVLRHDGTVWLNLGDSYAASRSYQVVDNKYKDVGNKIGHTVPFGLKPKDLVGIPWRVAFALQQPYQKSLIKREVDKSWLAGFMDGEGTISIRRHDSYSNGENRPACQDGFVSFISAGNNDRELLDFCVEITGYGKVAVKDKPKVDPRGIRSRRTYYGWRLDGNKAIEIICDIYPYLIAKKKQAVLAYNLDISNKNGKALRGNSKLPASEQEKREYLKQLINTCNQRQPVDIPSWCVEPKPIIEPGWYLRSEIIWAKPNPMPESVTDRPTKSHEQIFLLTKSAKYFYDAEAVKEPFQTDPKENYPARARILGRGEQDYPGNQQNSSGGFPPKGHGFHGRQGGSDRVGPQSGGVGSEEWNPSPTGRNRRSVWTITTKPCREAHFATFPPEIPEICIKAGSREGDTIMDPFSGAGTTGLVAEKLGRKFIGIELNPDYCQIANRRIESAELPMFRMAV